MKRQNRPARLNRGGDRALNDAIHAIAVTRMHCCPLTRAYIARCSRGDGSLYWDDRPGSWITAVMVS